MSLVQMTGHGGEEVFVNVGQGPLLYARITKVTEDRTQLGLVFPDNRTVDLTFLDREGALECLEEYNEAVGGSGNVLKTKQLPGVVSVPVLKNKGGRPPRAVPPVQVAKAPATGMSLEELAAHTDAGMKAAQAAVRNNLPAGE